MARPDEDPADVKLVLPHPTVVGVPREESSVKPGNTKAILSKAFNTSFRVKV